MNEKITIINRTDIPIPQIKIYTRNTADDSIVSQTAENIRAHLLKRHNSFVIRLLPNEAKKYNIPIKELPSKIIALSCTIKKPFINNDYDYLYRTVRGISCQILSTLFMIQLSYDIEYLTTYDQEEKISNYLGKLFADRDAYSITQPEKKVKFAYDYIVSTVKYDNENKMHSAYNALIDKKAVCEGCALLFYRFMAMFGIPCRIITGKGMRESHAWNIVKLGDFWYNIDVTWDLYKNPMQRSLGLYNYFLVGEDHFKDHLRDAYFESMDFKNQFPISKMDYQ